MRRSTDRLLTTHTGSLPRPDDLVDLLHADDGGAAVDGAALQARVTEAVAEVVERQVAAGVDVVSDGDMGRTSYATYVTHQLTGFEGDEIAGPGAPEDVADFPRYAARLAGQSSAYRRARRPVCTGPITYTGHARLARQLDDLAAAMVGSGATEAFVTAASPGVVAGFLPNHHYPDEQTYLEAIGEAMREEYEAIHRAGFVLQLDCPDLARNAHGLMGDADAARRRAELRVAVLNDAVAAIPAEAMRLHLCWGNYEGPHHRDVPLSVLLEPVLAARPAALSFEAANPRHAHEWTEFEDGRLPDGKVLIPGVLDSTTNYIEHPELVAQRLERFASLVGREQVLAGTDCGFGTWAGADRVDADIAYAKMRAMADGAELASARLW